MIYLAFSDNSSTLLALLQNPDLFFYKKFCLMRSLKGQGVAGTEYQNKGHRLALNRRACNTTKKIPQLQFDPDAGVPFKVGGWGKNVVAEDDGDVCGAFQGRGRFRVLNRFAPMLRLLACQGHWRQP